MSGQLEDPVPTEQQSRCHAELFWTLRRRRHSLTPTINQIPRLASPSLVTATSILKCILTLFANRCVQCSYSVTTCRVSVFYPADVSAMSSRNIAVVSALFDVATLKIRSLAFTLKLTFEGLRERKGLGGAENCVTRQFVIGRVQHAWGSENHTDCGRET